MPQKYRPGNQRGQLSYHYRPPIYETREEWRLWTEITLKCTGLPHNTSCEELYLMFERNGVITSIQLHGQRDASVTFCPPPHDAFWYRTRVETPTGEWHALRIELLRPKETFKHASPVHAGKFYDEHLKLSAASLDFGFMVNQDKMMIMQSVTDNVAFLLDLNRLEINVFFTMPAPTPTEHSPSHYKFQISRQQLSSVFEQDSIGDLSLILSAETPPSYFRERNNKTQTFDHGGDSWKQWFSWLRQTDIVADRSSLKNDPITLRKLDPLIDIGRWTTYRLTFHKASLSHYVYRQIKEVLSDYNLPITTTTVNLVGRESTSGWDIIDVTDLRVSSSTALLMDVYDELVHLPWSVRYQLEACISTGCLNEYNITREFLTELAALPERRARVKLEFAMEQNRRFYNPMDILSLSLRYTSTFSSRNLPKHYATVRTATITPSTVHYSSPTVDMSNRILRQYKELEDRFLRVRFSEEKSEGRIRWQANKTQDTVFTRVHRCLVKGIKIGDRHYEFLAMGNSQFREHGAYFFASTPSLTAADIRAQMGNFDDIKVVAKWASRLGQCFSTTRAIRGVGATKIVEIKDVKRNGYTFTDGVGKISKFLAQMIATELGLPNRDPPSLFQIRLGGIKGVVAVAPDAVGNEIHVRESQYKFPALYQGLEIIRWASYSHVSLNRQILSVLTYLGIKDVIFLRKMAEQLAELEHAMVDERTAMKALQERVDINQTSLTVASMIADGFMQDPFVQTILHLWRSWVTKLLKDKAGISIKDGAFVLGCTDESGTLLGHFDDAQNSTYDDLGDRIRALPQIFLQVDMGQGQYQVIKGLCLVARNPSLHPGDVRVVRAVDNPHLQHHKNVVVFPQTGDRDIPNMCSGGDLDGDDFMVIWDQELIPHPSNWNVPPMDFTSAVVPQELNRPVEIADVIPFFVHYMKNDSLRDIATSHLATADYRQEGVADPKCIKLAELHSIAVDYNKSGIPAIMDAKLRAHIKPHFMVSRYRRKNPRSYKSKTILGQLFDAVKEVDFVPLVHLQFDERVLSACPPITSQLREEIHKLKAEYDSSMRRIMAQHSIATEFEVWTAFVLGHNRLSNDYMFPQELGRIFASLRECFQEAVFEKCGGKDFALVLPFVAAMYKITAEEVGISIQQLRMAQLSVATDNSEISDGETGMKIEPKNLPLLSFPWLFHRELGMIANSAGPTSGISLSHTVSTTGMANGGGRTNAVHAGAPDPAEVETVEGITHKGEVLKLFEHPSSPDSDSDEGDNKAEMDTSDDHDMADEPDEWLGAFTDTSILHERAHMAGNQIPSFYQDPPQAGMSGSNTTSTFGAASVADNTAAGTPYDGKDLMMLDSPSDGEVEEGEIEEEEVEVETVTITDEPSALDQLLEMLG